MPWNFYGQLSDEDLKAIWPYLGTIPASRNHVPDPIPPVGVRELTTLAPRSSQVMRNIDTEERDR
jgi:hypothetical protein